MSGIALLLGTLAAAIVPVKGHDEVRSVIKVRGEDDRNPVVARTNEADARLLAGRERLAVLPFDVPPDAPDLASQRTGLMAAILDDVRYAPAYLAVDRAEVLAATARRPDVPGSAAGDAATGLVRLAGLGKDLGASRLITGSLAADGADLRLALNLVEIGEGRARVVAKAEARGPRDQIYALGDGALLDLLRQAKVEPGADRIEEIRKLPTRVFAARAEADEGFARLDQIAGTGPASRDASAIAREALGHADAAIKADRNYLRAHLLKASCLFALGAGPDLKAALEKARAKNDPARVDALTGLELEGDYLTFHDGQFDEAAATYEKMLGYDPGNLHALWSLTGLYSGDYGAADWARRPEAKAKAGRYAARLILAHPGSDLARAFMPGPP